MNKKRILIYLTAASALIILGCAIQIDLRNIKRFAQRMHSTNKARNEMQLRAIRFISQTTEIVTEESLKKKFYTGNGIAISKNKVLTNNHICERMLDQNLTPDVEYKAQDINGKIYNINGSKIIQAERKDLCVIIFVDGLSLPELEDIKILSEDPNMEETVINAAYSYANPLNNSGQNEFFMFQERYSKILERSTLNNNSINLPEEKEGIPKWTQQFFGPVYKLGSLLNYGDSGGGVYKIKKGKALLAGVIFAKEFGVPFPTQGYMVPASSILEFFNEKDIWED